MPHLPVGDDQKQVIDADGAITTEIRRAVRAGVAPETDDVQDVVDRDDAVAIGIAGHGDIVAVQTIDGDAINPCLDDGAIIEIGRRESKAELRRRREPWQRIEFELSFDPSTIDITTGSDDFELGPTETTVDRELDDEDVIAGIRTTTVPTVAVPTSVRQRTTTGGIDAGRRQRRAAAVDVGVTGSVLGDVAQA